MQCTDASASKNALLRPGRHVPAPKAPEQPAAAGQPAGRKTPPQCMAHPLQAGHRLLDTCSAGRPTLLLSCFSLEPKATDSFTPPQVYSAPPCPSCTSEACGAAQQDLFGGQGP